MSPEPISLSIWLILSTIIIATYLLTLLFTKNTNPRYRQTNLQHSTQNMEQEIENQEINNIQELEDEEANEEKRVDLDLLEKRSNLTSTEKTIIGGTKKTDEEFLKEILRELEETRRENSEPGIMIQIIDTENGENKFRDMNPVEELENLRKELSTLKRILKKQNE